MNPNNACPTDSKPARDRSLRALTPRRGASHTVRALAEGDDRRRKSILSDPRTRDAVRAVARLRGVPEADLEDVVQNVLKDACDDPRLPLGDPEEARRYLGGSSRFQSIDHARARQRDQQRLVPADTQTPADAPSPEDRAHARGLLERGRKLFPRTYHWFVRSELGGESQASLAAEAGVSAGHVRREVSQIRLTLRGLGTVAAALLFLVVGLRFYEWTHRGDEVEAASAKSQAAALRVSAKGECARAEWAACVKHLTTASQIDPSGETPELRELLENAESELRDQATKPQR